MRITWQDIALSVGLVVFGFVGTPPASHLQDLPPPDARGYALIIFAALALLFRSIRPLWTFGITIACIAVYLWLGYAWGPILISGVAAVYAVALRLPLRITLICCWVYVLAVLPQWLDNPLGIVTWSLGWVFLPAVAGLLMGNRRRSAVDSRARAVTEERLRLAQEVHDVVGHGLAVIAMQAGVALYVLDRDPAKARASLEAIRDTSREALDGLRGELDTLRGEAPLRPSTSLVDIPALAERMRSAGLPVSVELDTSDAPDDIATAAYRIAQEALTNVLRHAGPDATAQVRVWREDGVLHVEVTDTGTAAAFDEGHGITGMRNRAESLGGHLDAGPRPAGGFAVHARIPLPS